MDVYYTTRNPTTAHGPGILTMYLKRIVLQNVGPISELNCALPFDAIGNPKPLVMVGQGQLQLSLGSRNDLQQVVVVPAAGLTLHRDAGVLRMLLQE